MKVTVVEEGTRSELRFQRGSLKIGRALDNDIRLTGKLVSRYHCRVQLSDAGLSIEDLGSANGTRVNGERVTRARLRVGDELDVGGALFRFQIEPSELHNAGEQTQDLGQARGATPPGSNDLADIGAVGLCTLDGEQRRDEEGLRVFARLTHALLQETELDKLLRQILDGAVSLAKAERGFLLLARSAEASALVDAQSLEVRVARSYDQTDIALPSSRLSMGIARTVLARGRPLLSVDAGRDERFSEMASVEDLRLRSVLCLPVRSDLRLEGVLYLDNRLQQGAFSEQVLDQVELFAVHAALAIRNARHLSDLRAQNQRLSESRAQIERLNEQLGRKMRDRDVELSVVRAELGRERGRHDYTGIVGASEAMRQVFEQLDRITESDLPVLVQGESGTGKELVARAIHVNGARKSRPFVSMNCAALPDTLLESELFGHTRGAFTGAERAKKGLIEQAHGGTLFLDEIGDMSQEMQKKLLRVLQEGELRPLGADHTVKVDVRLLAASHCELAQLVAAGSFREDLFYRLNVLALRLPPLRERREDIPLLAEALLARAAREAGRPLPALTHEALAALCMHEWPGNVRELENEMRRVVVLTEGSVTVEQLSPAVRAPSRMPADAPAPERSAGASLREAVARFERGAIQAALQGAGGNKSRAAAELCISRFALQRKLEKYGLESPGSELEGSQFGAGEPEAEADA